jgi:hypothetical protein
MCPGIARRYEKIEREKSKLIVVISKSSFVGKDLLRDAEELQTKLRSLSSDEVCQLCEGARWVYCRCGGGRTGCADCFGDGFHPCECTR